MGCAESYYSWATTMAQSRDALEKGFSLNILSWCSIKTQIQKLWICWNMHGPLHKLIICPRHFQGIVLLQSFFSFAFFFHQLYGMHVVCKSVDRAIMCLRATPVSPHCLAPSSVSPHPVLVLDPALMRLVSPPCSNHRLPAMFRLCYIYVFLWISDANIMQVSCKVTPSISYLATLWLMSKFPICLPFLSIHSNWQNGTMP